MKTPPHNANAVFNAVKKEHRLTSDAEMGRLIDVRPDAISSMRAGRVPFGPTVQMKILEKTKISERRLKNLMSTPSFGSIF